MLQEYGIQTSLQQIDLTSIGYIPRSWEIMSHGNTIFNLLWKLYAAFNGHTDVCPSSVRGLPVHHVLDTHYLLCFYEHSPKM